MRRGTFAIASLALVLGLSACAPQDTGAGPGQWGANKTTAGTLLGGIGGAVAGAQFGQGNGRLAAVALGSLAGAFIGHEVGTSLDRADQLAMQQSTQQALESAPTGTAVAWKNPDSGHYGTITPVKTYEAPTGAPCREYSETVTIGGKTQQAYGRACRQADGAWRIVSN